MKVLTPEGDPDDFFEFMAGTECQVLFLDYDGTLAPFQEKRDQAFPAPGIRKALERIHDETQTELIFVSGRAIDDLLPLLGLSFTPEVWGSHGRERLYQDGTREGIKLDKPTKDIFRKAETWASENGWGDAFEKKEGCVAFHWRPFPETDMEKIRKEAISTFGLLAREGNLATHQFDGGIEIQVPGVNKGVAIQKSLNDYFGVSTAIAFLGDDLTDEDGFLALRERGLSVLVRPEFRETAADLWLQSTDEVLEFLNRWIAACSLVDTLSEESFDE